MQTSAGGLSQWYSIVQDILPDSANDGTFNELVLAHLYSNGTGSMRATSRHVSNTFPNEGLYYYPCLYTCVRTLYVRTHCMHTRVYAHTCVCVCNARKHVHTHMHTRTHAHTHTCTHELYVGTFRKGSCIEQARADVGTNLTVATIG